MSCALLPCRHMLAHILLCADTLSHICHNDHACLVNGEHSPLVGAFVLMHCSMVVCVIHISLMQRLVHTRRHAEQARHPRSTKRGSAALCFDWIWGWCTNCRLWMFKVHSHCRDAGSKHCNFSVSMIWFTVCCLIPALLSAFSLLSLWPCTELSSCTVCPLPLLILTLLRLQWAGGCALILDTLALIWSYHVVKAWGELWLSEH